MYFCPTDCEQVDCGKKPTSSVSRVWENQNVPCADNPVSTASRFSQRSDRKSSSFVHHSTTKLG